MSIKEKAKGPASFDRDPPPPRFPGAGALRPPPQKTPMLEAVASQGDARPAQARNPVPLPLVFKSLSGRLVEKMMAANEQLETALALNQPAAHISPAARALIDNPAMAADCRLIAFRAKSLHPRQVRALLATLGYLASSERRHAAAAQTALPLPPHLTVALCELGAAIGHYPRDAADTAWLIDPPFGWTRSRRERLLGSAVRHIEQRFFATFDQLRPVLQAQKTLVDARGDLVSASQVIKDLIRIEGVPEFGADLPFQPYLAPFEVGAAIFPGPHPMNTAGWKGMLELLGKHKSGRFHHSLRDLMGTHAGRSLDDHAVEPGLLAATIISQSLFELGSRMSLGEQFGIASPAGPEGSANA